MKKFWVMLLSLICCSAFASSCPRVVPWPPNNIPTFCNQFEEAGYCHCALSGLPYGYCRDLKLSGIYKRMLILYHSIENACADPKVQDDVTPQVCVAEWKYYLTYCPKQF